MGRKLPNCEEKPNKANCKHVLDQASPDCIQCVQQRHESIVEEKDKEIANLNRSLVEALKENQEKNCIIEDQNEELSNLKLLLKETKKQLEDTFEQFEENVDREIQMQNILLYQREESTSLQLSQDNFEDPMQIAQAKKISQDLKGALKGKNLLISKLRSKAIAQAAMSRRDKNDDLKQKSLLISELEATLKKTKSDLKTKINQCSQLVTRVEVLKETHSNNESLLQQKLVELQTTLDRADGKLQAKNAKISALKDALTETQNTLTETQDTLTETQDTLTETQDTLTETQDTLTETQGDLHSLLQQQQEKAAFKKKPFWIRIRRRFKA